MFFSKHSNKMLILFKEKNLFFSQFKNNDYLCVTISLHECIFPFLEIIKYINTQKLIVS